MQAQPAPTKPIVVVADGNTQRRVMLANALAPMYDIERYSHVSKALDGIRAMRPAAAVVGDELPDTDGYDLVRMLRLDPSVAALKVLMIVAVGGHSTAQRVTQCGAQCYLPETCSQATLLDTVSRLINAAVEARWDALLTHQATALKSTVSVFNVISAAFADGEVVPYRSIAEACKPLVECVAVGDYQGILKGVREHDNYTYAHSLRVATLLSLFGSHLGLTQGEQTVLASGGLLHDVGKMMIPKLVLNKPDRLNDDELKMMRAHVAASEAYLREFSDLPRGVVTIAAQHHEKLDGTGYPRGLKATELDYLARMASVVDVFSALTDRRVYKVPMGPEAALGVMAGQMRSHLDMGLVRMFRPMILDTMRRTKPSKAA
jgi:putative nucleotidyltransferase with HDIG domain